MVRTTPYKEILKQCGAERLITHSAVLNECQILMQKKYVSPPLEHHVECPDWFKMSLKGTPVRTLLTAPLAGLLCAPSSRCILGIETSLKMTWWDRFLGHQQKDGGRQRRHSVFWFAPASPGVSPSSVFDLMLWLGSYLSWSVCLSTSDLDVFLVLLSEM